MKTIRFVSLLFCMFMLQLASASAFDSEPVLSVVSTQPNGTLKVRVRNNSGISLRLWKDSNSWGASRWRVLLVRNGRLIAMNEKPQSFSSNSPEFFEIKPKDSVVQNLDVNDGTWAKPTSHPVSFLPGDIVIVVYDVPFDHECLSQSVWYGVASTISTIQ